VHNSAGIKIGRSVLLNVDMDKAQQLVTEALKEEGFGVLTEIDVKNTLKQKLNVDFRPYKILGACNPGLAHRALTEAPEIGLLLPCNVTLAQPGDGQVEVSLVDPLAMLGIVQNPALEEIAAEAAQKLEKVAQILASQKKI
jgi:uncharacterized protein (DUF302 family)